VKALPCLQHPLRATIQPGTLQVQPWRGHKKIVCNGYFLFVPGETFEDGKADTKYDTKNPVQAGVGTTFRDAERELELTVHIQPQVSLIDLELIGHDHVRWVAMDYKQHIAEQTQQAAMVRNSFYLKKMNIVNDLASWTGWELLLKSETHAIACVLFRRQYVPPLLDTAQDMSITVKCPMSCLNEGKLTDEDLILEAHLIADSMSAAVKNCTAYPNLYRDMIQAKLDALLFNEEATKWIDNMLGLKPRCEGEARSFVRSILKMLQDENALNMPDLLAKTGGSIFPEPMNIHKRLLAAEKEAFKDSPNREKTVNAYATRLARYFASTLDGGILGADFTLQDITGAFLITHISQEKQKEIIHFLLHIRPRNMELPYVGMTVSQMLQSTNFNDYCFNDKVMQALLELNWVEKCLANSTGETGMSKEYAKFLALLLVSKNISTSLKAAICRQIISAQQNSPHYSILIPALMETMVQGNLYLTTYCTVTLVNLSRGQEMVKNMLVSRGIAQICVDQLKTTDDDLVQYTLVLLTNITKSMHHQEVVTRCGVGQVLIELLINSYAKPDKKKVLTELAGVIGQLCNDEETRKTLSGPETSTVNCLLETFKRAGNSMKLKSKVMFCLKQLCVNNNKDRDKVGAKVIESVVHDFHTVASAPATIDIDFSMNAILLLLLLSLSMSNCKAMHKADFASLMPKLMMTKLWSLESARDKLTQLDARVQKAGRLDAE